VQQGEIVMREGDTAEEAYVIERGTLEARGGGARGTSTVLGKLGRGDWVGEMSLLLGEPRSATVVATSDAQLRRVTRETFGRVLAEDPARTQELLRQLARRLREADGRLAGGA
jgi:CRP/FNR family cyclic AMP-dependent transcriptional regulator